MNREALAFILGTAFGAMLVVVPAVVLVMAIKGC